jgi:hypothetical protein
VGIQAGNIQIVYDEGPNPTPGLNPVVISTVCPPAGGEDDISLGDRVVVDVSAPYDPLLPLVNIPPFLISSDTARTIVKDVAIEGWPAGIPTNTPNYPLTETSQAATASALALTQTAEASATNGALTETAVVEQATQTAAAETATMAATETQWSQTQTAAVPPTIGPSPTPTNTPETPTPTNTIAATPTPSLTYTMTPSPTATSDPCPNWTYSHSGSKITWTIINQAGSNSFTLRSLTVPWSASNQGVRMIGVEFGTATLWTGSDRYPSSFAPTAGGGFEYAWQAAWSIGAPAFNLPAVAGFSKDITMSWGSPIGSVDGSPAVAVFVNDQTGGTCTVQQTFIYTP